MYRNLFQFSIHQNDPTLRCIPAKWDHVNSPLTNSFSNLILHTIILKNKLAQWAKFRIPGPVVQSTISANPGLKLLLEIHACSNPRLTNQKCNYILGT